jgi:prepilin peptidase CpaA
MGSGILLVAILPALLAAAAVFDLTSFTIPNIVPGSMLLLFAAFLIATSVGGHSPSWDQTSLHILAGAFGLAVGMGMFALGWVGGGDAKLFAGATLWLGWDALYEYAVLATLLGGVLTVALLMLRKIPLPQILADQPWLARLADRKSGVPYGVALSCAALIVLPNTDLFRLAAVN